MEYQIFHLPECGMESGSSPLLEASSEILAFDLKI
jgi:hypothetical protein